MNQQLHKKLKDQKNKAHCTERYEADILEALKEKPHTSVQLRHKYDCLRVAGTIFDLRHRKGHNIQTHYTYDDNPGGSKHRVALYSLLPGKWEGLR